MNEIKLIQYLFYKACSTQKQVHDALMAFGSDLKEVFEEYVEDRINGVGARKKRLFDESIARYQAMEEEAEQELEKLRRPNH